MKRYLIALFVCLITNPALSDGDIDGSITLTKRQDSAAMQVTSVNLKQGGGTITAEGQMGEYGRVYLTYELTADAGRSGGTVIGEGRGFLRDGSFAYGSGTGAFYREGTVFTMHILFRINDGTQNFDRVVFDAFTGKLSHDAFVLK